MVCNWLLFVVGVNSKGFLDFFSDEECEFILIFGFVVVVVGWS